MKIAHIVRRFSFDEWGGTESVVWNIALQQKAQGFTPEILCTAALDKVGVEEQNGIVIRRYPYFYPYFPMPKKDKIALDKKGGNPFSIQLISALKSGNYDIFHIHAGGRIAQYSAKIGKKIGVPCIMSLHGGSCVVPKQEMELMLKPLKNKFSYGGIIDRMLRMRFVPESQMNMLLALSKEETKALEQKIPQVKVQSFPNGILHRELVEVGDFRKKYNIMDDKKIILCISRIDYQKNQKILLEIIKRNVDTHLLLIGPVTAKWYLDEVNNLANELDVKNRLTVIPGLPPDSIELLQALKTAYCFILPSRHEPFGIVALEALDAELPLIASNVGGLKDFLENGKNALLFEDNNIQSLCDAYAELPAMREKLIANGITTAQAYNWKTLTEKLTTIYQELL